MCWRDRVGRRHGLTLLEVVLALAILSGSLAVLAQLVGIGIRAASTGRDLTRGQLLAESTMSEIAAGIVPAASMGQIQATTDPDWTVSADVQPSRHEGIVVVTVLVEKQINNRRPSQVVLTRWLRDPSIEIPEDESVDEAGSSASGSSTSTAGGSSGSGEANSDRTNNAPPTGGAAGGAPTRGRQPARGGRR